MLNLNKDGRAVTKIVLAMLTVAFVFSFMGHVFASSGPTPSAAVPSAVPAQGYASFANPDGLIRGTENGSIPKIEFLEFFVNIAKTTGVYAFFTDAVAKTTPAGDAITVFAGRNY
jgi:hypothetical protein